MTLAGATGEAVSGAAAMMGSATGMSSFMAGAGQMIGALGPYTLAAAAAIKLLSSSGETRGGGQYGYDFGDGLVNNRRASVVQGAVKGVNLLEGPSGGEIESDANPFQYSL